MRIKFIHQLLLIIIFALSSTSSVLAEPQLFVEKNSNTLAISSNIPASIVYVRIGWPNGHIQEITQVEFVDWHPPLDAPDGQYRFDCYTYTTIPQGEMSKQEWERAQQSHSTQHSGVFNLKVGAIVLDTVETDGVGDKVGIEPQSRLGTTNIVLEALGYVMEALVPVANAVDLEAQSTEPSVTFDDTELAGNDWKLIGNAEADNTGTFSLRDQIGGNDHTVISILGNNASTINSNSLVVGVGGDIFLGGSSVFIDRSANTMGIGTTSPNGSLHILDAASPEIILQDIGGPAFELEATSNEIGIKENGGGFLFEVETGASSNSLVIDQTSNIGMGIDDPGTLVSNAGQPASLHIVKSNGNASVLIEENNPMETDTKVQLEIRNNGTAQFALIDESADGGDWRFQNFKDTFRVTAAGTGVGEMTLERNGNVTFVGTVSANGGSSTFPDYVFEPSYKLMPLNDLQAYIGENQHLPNIPSKQEIESKGNVINMTELQYKLLEKVEELTLYTLNQQKTIEQQQQTAFQQRKALEQQQQLINTLIKRVEKLDAS